MRVKLTLQIAAQSALVIFGGMLVYAAWQHSGSDSSGDGYLLLAHLWHALVLGLLLFLFLQWRLQRLVYRPLSAIFEHGHEMASGRFRYRAYPKTNNELEEVMWTMNFLAAHVDLAQQSPWQEYADSIDRLVHLMCDRDDMPIELLADVKLLADNLRKLALAQAEFECRNKPCRPAVASVAPVLQPEHIPAGGVHPEITERG